MALGIPELREAIAASYADRYGLEVGVDDVVLTTGSSGASSFVWINNFSGPFSPM